MPIKLRKSIRQDDLKKLILIGNSGAFLSHNIDALDLNSRLEQIVDTTEIEVKSDFNIQDFEFINTISKKVIPGKDIYINYASDLSKSQDEELISLLRDKGIDFVIEGDDLIVRKGNYRINEDLTFLHQNELNYFLE